MIGVWNDDEDGSHAYLVGDVRTNDNLKEVVDEHQLS